MVAPFSGRMCHECVTNKTGQKKLLCRKDAFYGGGCVFSLFQYMGIDLNRHALIMPHDSGDLFRGQRRDLVAQFRTEVVPKNVRRESVNDFDAIRTTRRPVEFFCDALPHTAKA